MIVSLPCKISRALPTWLQWVGVMAAGTIPFIESHFGSVGGVIAGPPTPPAIAAAVAGNIATMLLLMLGAHAVRGRTARSNREHSPGVGAYAGRSTTASLDESARADHPA